MEGPSAPLGNCVGEAAHGALQIGKGVAQTVGVLFRQVEGVALPVEFDAVPVCQLAGFGDALQGVLADLRHCHVPRRGRPSWCPLAEDPFRVALAERREMGSLCRCHLLWPQRLGSALGIGPEVVVVHAHRGVHAEPHLVAAAHELAVQIDVGIEHRPQALGPAHVADGEVAAALCFTDHRQQV